MDITKNELKDMLNGLRDELKQHVDTQTDKQGNEFQRQLEKQREEFQHFMGIMKEDSDSKMQLIGEQFQDIKATLTSHTEMIGSLAEDMHIVKSDVQIVKSAMRMKVDYQEFEALASRVSLLEEKIRK